MMIQSNKLTLDNGLRIVHYPVADTQMVAMDILYDVGSKDENPEHTGLAHLFEHLMFGGSVHIPDYDTPCEMAGGQNNAWTSEDVTNFYVTLPAENVETAFWLESDRMNALSFSRESLRIQKKVVMQEYRERNNGPYNDASRLLRKTAYTTHPYRWLPIGRRLSHIERTKREDIRRFFYHHYAPNNAVLCVVGNISFERTVELARKWFGPVPARMLEPRTYSQEPPQTKRRLMTVERDVPANALYMAFHTCPRTERDYMVFDVLSDLLANGSSSRLNRHLVREERLFTSIDAYITEHTDTGLIVISGQLADGVPYQKAREAVHREIHRLGTEVTDYELEKVRNKFESQWIFSNMSILSLACNLAYADLLGKDINTQVSDYRSVAQEDITRVVWQYLQPEQCSELDYKSIHRRK